MYKVWNQEELPLENCFTGEAITEQERREAFLSCPCILCHGLRKLLDLPDRE